MHPQISRETAQAIVKPFYDVLNKPASKNVAEILRASASSDWRSYSSGTASKGRDEFIAQVIGFGKLIPDLAWDIQEVLVDGDRIIVRSEASGTPAGDFMGVPHSGRSFKVMTIDIHTTQEGKLVTAYHIEDWASALRQLAGR
jgi:predicted ester cyclase